LHAYLNTSGHPFGSATQPVAWVTPPAPIDTRFVSVPGLLTAQCVSNERSSYLEVTVHGDSADPRADDLVGDLKPTGEINPARARTPVTVSNSRAVSASQTIAPLAASYARIWPSTDPEKTTPGMAVTAAD